MDVKTGMKNTETGRGEATLYYDGQCPLCAKEMDRLAALKSEQLELVNIHQLAENIELPDKEALLRNLHLRLPNGEMLTGVAANVTAWEYTPRGRWLRWLKWPLISPVADFVYGWWAEWRYRRLYGRSPAAQGRG